MSIPFTWIYLVLDPYTGLFKIGKADNPDVRFKQLCNPSSYGTIPAAPTSYTLIEAWLAPETKEKELHERYASCRVRGEWFDLCVLFTCVGDSRQVLPSFVWDAGFENATRWVEGRTHNDDAWDELYQSYGDAARKLDCAWRLINKAKLLGYDPTMFLIPAPPNIDPSKSDTENAEAFPEAINANAIDFLQEVGEPAF